MAAEYDCRHHHWSGHCHLGFRTSFTCAVGVLAKTLPPNFIFIMEKEVSTLDRWW